MTGASAEDLPEHDVDERRLEDLRRILNPTKLRIIQQILASPTGALSAPELAARNTITDSTIRDHLQALRNCDPQIVTSLEPSESPVPHGIPRRYFAVTEYGVGLLKQTGFYEPVGMLFDAYEAADLSLPHTDGHPRSIEEIEEYQYRPEPDWL